MRNRKERQAYVDNENNWQIIDSMQFAVLKRLMYKGDSWLKIQHLVQDERFDYKERTRRIKTELDDKGIYIVSEDGTALNWTTKTQIVDRMTELDQQIPDRTGGGPLPKTLDIRRKSHEQ